MKNPSILYPKLLIFALLILMGGCRELNNEYGASKGEKGTQSLNGFATLRKSYAKSGYKTRDIKRLSHRVQKNQVVVWTPQNDSVIPTDVTLWFEKWLAMGDRTLVYIIPDSGSEVAYWQHASKFAPPEQRIAYRKRAAQSVNQRMQWRLNRMELPSNGWFTAKPIARPSSLTSVKGKWASEKSQESLALGGDEGSPMRLQMEFSIVAYAPPKKQSKQKTVTPPANTKGTTATTPTPPTPPASRSTGPTGPSSLGWNMQTETKPTGTKLRFRSALESEQSETMVATIHSRRWKNSRIIIVGGGSLVTNYGLTRPLGQMIASKLIQSSANVNREYDRSFAKQAGFLTTDWRGVSVNDRHTSSQQASGMELLTVWPISLVTIHGVLLGFIVCLVLFPIFGRPRTVENTRQSDFSDHLDAVAALMIKAKGEQYARQRISEYFQRVRGETSGPWVGKSKPPNQASGNSSTMDDDSTT